MDWLILSQSLYMNSKIYIIILLIGFVSCSDETAHDVTEQQLFNIQKSSYTHLDFSNDLNVDLSSKFNLLDFDYFYNGAGVGIADINNDGLEDVLLTGNMVPNKLFLNKGNLQFEDISEKANINQGKQWSNGVTFADVNDDGWLDIYISQGGPHEEEKRRNLLFINQKDLSFKERASTAGLDDTGISTQSAFFDYDQDGDLDCIVMNESILYGYDPISFLQKIASDKYSNQLSLSHLYRNDGDVFTNVSIDAGINKPTFGLGLVVTDLNDDSLIDIYITNDYYLPDAMYINQGDGTFKDEIKRRTQQVSMFGMGVDAEDINQDGNQDLFVLDMAASDHIRSKTLMASMNTADFDLLVKDLRFQYQYMFNSLQLNDGEHSYKNIAQLAGVAKTDWSWAGLIADFDLDGKNDLFVTNGYRRYGLDNDFKIRVNQAKRQHNGQVPLSTKKELYYSMPEGKLPNIMYQNMGELQFQDVSTEWGFDEPTYSNGAAYSDLDNDGDLDLIINNIDQEVMLYKNNSIQHGKVDYLKVDLKGKSSETFAKVTLTFTDTTKQTIESKRVRGYRSAVSNKIHFGFEKNKIIRDLKIDWTDQTSQTIADVNKNSLITINQNESIAKSSPRLNENKLFKSANNGKYNLNYVHRENDYDDFKKEILLPIRQSTLGPIVNKADINNDGLEDIFIGGAAGYSSTVFIQKNNKFIKKNIPVFEEDLAFEDSGSVFFDIDMDKDLDLFICSGGNAQNPDSPLYNNRLFLNNGEGEFIKSGQSALNNDFSSTATAIVVDLNNDGQSELIVANRIKPQHYPIHSPSIIYSVKNGQLVDVTNQWSEDLNSFGIINDLIASDIDGDGDQDLIAVGEWTGIGIFINENNKLILDDQFLNQTGWWFSVTETDVNNDDRPDFIVGNLGLNSKYKASQEKPLKIFAEDFDSNGTNDIVLSNKYKDEYVPLRGRECSSQQMPFIAEKYPSYESFAHASLIDIYGDKVSDSYNKEVIDFKSYIMINTGTGFKLKALPIQAQEFPIFSCISKDLNGDDFEDLIIAGNIYQTEVETPRLDSGKGLVLISNGKNNYDPVSTAKSGLNTPGDVKSLEYIKLESANDILVVGKNQSVLQIVEIQL